MPSRELTEHFRYVRYGPGGFDSGAFATVLRDLESRVDDVRQIGCTGRSDGVHPGEDFIVNESTRLMRLQHSVNGLVHASTALKSVVDGLVSLETLTRGRPCRADD